MLSTERLERLRKALHEERTSLADSLAGMAEDSDLLAHRDNIGVGNHLAEDATMAYDQAAALALSRNHQWMLAEVNDAIQRLEKGTFGNCERCGQEIDFARLKAKPYARLCIDCQKLAEL
jgi:DnaK suppressor protein